MQKKINRFAIAILFMCLVFAVSFTPSFASTQSAVPADVLIGLNARASDEAGWGSVDSPNGEINDWNDVLRLVRIIITPLAAVTIAAGGLMMASSGIFSAASEKQGSSRQEVGKQMILYAILALFAVYLLPLIIKAAVSFFNVNGRVWTPPTPGGE